MTGKLLTIVLLFLIYAFISINVFAYTTTGPSPTPVAYTLPYPGLLPDSPLYFLKVLRDKIEAFFISNPVALAAFDIQESDKRTEASYMLVTQRKNVPLAESTFSKGENYFQDAIDKTKQAKAQGMSIQAIPPQLYISNQKHIEVLRQLEAGLSSQQKKLFTNDASRLSAFDHMVSALQSKK